MKTYIYKLENCYNNPQLIYIGKTIDPICRLKHHKKTYGDQINMVIIDEINSILTEDWLPLESKWISIMKQTPYILLNQNNGGGGSNGEVYPVLAKNMNGKTIKWYSSIQEASIELNIRPQNIKNAIKSKKQSAGYYWVKDIDIKWPDTPTQYSSTNEWVFRP
jgi:hypothetical protein